MIPPNRIEQLNNFTISQLELISSGTGTHTWDTTNDYARIVLKKIED